MTPDKKAFMIAAIACRTDDNAKNPTLLRNVVSEIEWLWAHGVADVFDPRTQRKGDAAKDREIETLQGQVTALTKERDYYRTKNKEMQRVALAQEQETKQRAHTLADALEPNTCTNCDTVPCTCADRCVMCYTSGLCDCSMD